ncbi:MAG TPA: TonB-dependent receptor, partial [Gemmatimonadaceae bacterium]|nr:TonB-dependent receptor [Gemmatimonadaceae bacterium]
APDGGGASLDGTHGVFSPKLGAFVHLTPTLGAFANVSRGFRSSDGVIEDPALQPITEWAYESGLKLDRGRLSASATLFRMDVSNEQTFNPITLASENGGASRRQGLELDTKLPTIARLATVSANWTFNDARYRRLVAVAEDGDEPPANLDGLRVYNTSKSQGEAAVDLTRPGAPWRVRASGTWSLGYSPFDEPGVVLPGYGLANLGAAWTFAKAEVDAGVRNAFDRAYAELVAGHVYSPGEPRTLYLRVRVRE